MNWSVTYRAKDGGQTVDVFEAESREALFKVLSDKGITAIRIEATSAKRKAMRNRGSGSSLHPTSPIPHPLFKGVVAGVAVVAFAFGLWYFLMRGTGNGEQRTVEKPKKQSKIAEVKPSISPKPVQPKPEPPKVDPNARPTKVGEEVNGYVMLPNGKMHRRRGIRTVESGGVDRSHPAAIFDHSTDNEFAVILTLQPGESLIGGPMRHGKNYEESFRESLKTPIIVSKDDPDEVKALKRAVIETRLQMKEALDRGEDIKKIIADSYEEAQKLAIYKDTLREQVNAASKEENMTDEELDDLITAANQMLEAKGIAPMKFGALTRARIRNLKK